MTELNRPSRRDLHREIEDIYAKWPVLRGLTATEDFCCSGCAVSSVAEEVGWPAAEAWEEIRTLRWLLGEDG